MNVLTIKDKITLHVIGSQNPMIHDPNHIQLFGLLAGQKCGGFGLTSNLVFRIGDQPLSGTGSCDGRE